MKFAHKVLKPIILHCLNAAHGGEWSIRRTSALRSFLILQFNTNSRQGRQVCDEENENSSLPHSSTFVWPAFGRVARHSFSQNTVSNRTRRSAFLLQIPPKNNSRTKNSALYWKPNVKKEYEQKQLLELLCNKDNVTTQPKTIHWNFA
jgi:hypothetical protein